MLNRKNKNQSGFTLIELLVVIAIMGLLATIVMTSLNGARKKGRDTRRIADLRQFNTAIQFYITDYGHAPYVGAFNCSASNPDPSCGFSEVQTDRWDILKTELTPYMSKLPKDPCGINCYNAGAGIHGYYAYVYWSPSTISQWSGGVSSNSDYAVFAENMEVASSIWNITYKTVPTFGFINHSMGNSF